MGKTPMKDTPGRMKEYLLLGEGAKHFSSNMVYYDNLDEYDPAFHSKVKTEILDYQSEIASTAINADKIYKMAAAELAKEISIINKNFGGSFDSKKILEDYKLDVHKQVAFYKDLNRAINYALGFEKVYDRNVTLIKTSKARTSTVDGKKVLEGGQKSIITYFPSYLDKQLQIDLDGIKNKIEKILLKYINNIEEAKNEIREMLTKELKNTCRKAAMDMFSKERGLELEAELKKSGMSKDEIKQQREAYTELREALKKKNANSFYANKFLEELFRIYKIDQVIDQLTKQISGMDDLEKQFSKSVKTKGKNKGKEYYDFNNKDSVFNNAIHVAIHSRGGEMLEATENLATNVFFASLGIDGSSIRTGTIGNMKADNIITIGIDKHIISESLAKSYVETQMEEMNNNNNDSDEYSNKNSSKRAKNIQAIEDLHKNLKGINNGFIIYTSAKNYTYNSNFDGFHSGSDQSIENFVAMFQKVHRTVRKNFRTVGGLILQLGTGTIGHSILKKENLEDLLAHSIAYLLFDDFETIGYKMTAATTNYLHLMDLNGVFVPISLILYLLADAISDIDKNPRSVVSVHITPPDDVIFKRQSGENWQQTYSRVLYGTVGKGKKSTGGVGKENIPQGKNGNLSISTRAWYYQRQEAQRQAKISADFLKNFQKVITEFF